MVHFKLVKPDNSHYPDTDCHYCPRKATKKFTGSLGFSKYLCDPCSDKYREWHPELLEEEAGIEPEAN